MDPQEHLKEASSISMHPEALGRDEQCPLCGGDNQCRVAKGNLYKGDCWCHRVVVPENILKLLAEDVIDPACFCPSCLQTIASILHDHKGTGEILAEVRRVVLTKQREGKEDPPSDFYLDDQGNTVFTAAYHLKRGNCCENQCQHCPY